MCIPGRTAALAKTPAERSRVHHAYGILDRERSRPGRLNRRRQRLRHDAPPDREVLHPVSNTCRNLGIRLSPEDGKLAHWPGQHSPGGRWWDRDLQSADTWRRVIQAASYLAFHCPRLLEHPQTLLDLVETAIPGASRGIENRREELRRWIIANWRMWTHSRRDIAQRGGTESGRRRRDRQYVKLLQVAGRLRRGLSARQIADTLGFPLSSVYRYIGLVDAAQGLDPRLDLRVPEPRRPPDSHERTPLPLMERGTGTSGRRSARETRSRDDPSPLSDLLTPRAGLANRRSFASLPPSPRPPPPHTTTAPGIKPPFSENARIRNPRAKEIPSPQEDSAMFRSPCPDCGDTGWAPATRPDGTEAVRPCTCRKRRKQSPDPPAPRQRPRPRRFPPAPCGKDRAAGD